MARRNATSIAVVLIGVASNGYLFHVRDCKIDVPVLGANLVVWDTAGFATPRKGGGSSNVFGVPPVG